MQAFLRRCFFCLPRTTPPSRQAFSSSTARSSSSTAAMLYAATVSTVSTASAAPDEVKERKHHAKDGGFKNPWDSWRDFSAPGIISAMVWRIASGRAHKPNTTPPTVAVREPEFLPSRDTPNLRATWLGHACYLVEFPGGLRVLFDPVFSERCSPFSWLGPQRYTKAPCQVDKIPFVDVVVISHNHYDHLDHPTISKIKAKHPNVHFLVPLGNEKWFHDSGIREVTELDWWEERDISLTPSDSKSGVSVSINSPKASTKDDITARIGCLPCQHMSARGPFDKAKTLWSSWSIISGGKKVWFGGDTGYRAVPELPDNEDDYGPEKNYPHCPAFKQIGELRGPFDLGLIPIGAYRPRWIMSPMHANPFDSVNIFKDTACKRAMGIHWGTWVLTEEDVLEPPKLLRQALTKNNLPEQGVFDICEIGESREF